MPGLKYPISLQNGSIFSGDLQDKDTSKTEPPQKGPQRPGGPYGADYL